MEDLDQDVNKVPSFSLNGTFSCWFFLHLDIGKHINPNEKSNKYKSSLLIYVTKAITEHFLLKPSVQVYIEVNDSALNFQKVSISKRKMLTIFMAFLMHN